MLKSDSNQNIIVPTQKQTNIGQRNRTERSVINPCVYVLIIFDKDAKNIQYKKDNLFKT